MKTLISLGHSMVSFEGFHGITRVARSILDLAPPDIFFTRRNNEDLQCEKRHASKGFLTGMYFSRPEKPHPFTANPIFANPPNRGHPCAPAALRPCVKICPIILPKPRLSPR